MSNLQTGLLLFAIGFPSVFIILSLVMALGRILIDVTNRFKSSDNQKDDLVTSVSESLSPKKITAIVSAISIVTQGRGSVSKIEKK